MSTSDRHTQSPLTTPKPLGCYEWLALGDEVQAFFMALYRRMVEEVSDQISVPEGLVEYYLREEVIDLASDSHGNNDGWEYSDFEAVREKLEATCITLSGIHFLPLASVHGLFLVCAAFLVIVGAIDDARDLPANFRLGVQVVLGAVLTFVSGTSLTTFGNLLGFGAIELGFLGPWVTIAAVIGATNAFNMIDGIDGLAGSLSLVALGSLALQFSASSGFVVELALTVGIGCALVPYLMANLRIPPFQRRIFMGDAGSIFIGFAVVWLLVNATQPGAMVMRPVTALWIIAIPLMDMVAIMVRHARKGQSVMKPDRDHLHHIFMRAGFTDREALLLITAVALIFAGIGLLGDFYQIPEWIMFAGFMGLFALYDRSLKHVWRLLVVFRKGHREYR